MEISCHVVVVASSSFIMGDLRQVLRMLMQILELSQVEVEGSGQWHLMYN